MGADDPYQAQWNLRPRIAALRAEATGIRRHTDAEYRRQLTELGTERDRIAREKVALEQSAKAADQQAANEARLASEKDADAARYDTQAAAAEAKGDPVEAEELREVVRGVRAAQEAHVARARQATLDAASTREQAAGRDRRLSEADVGIEDAKLRLRTAEAEIDKLEDQARLYEQARTSYLEAALAGDDVPRRAGAEVQAEALLARAQAIVVDRAAIRVVMPDLPETTPGIDDPPPPLPEGAASALDPTPDDELALAVGAPDVDADAAVDGAPDDVVGDGAMDNGDLAVDGVLDRVPDDAGDAPAAMDATWSNRSPSYASAGDELSFDAPADPFSGAGLGEPTLDEPSFVADGSDLSGLSDPSGDDRVEAFAGGDTFDA